MSRAAAVRPGEIGALLDAAVVAVRAATSDTLVELVAEVSRAAREGGLSVLTARFPPCEEGLVVLLDPDHTTVPDVVAAAVAGGSGLLFVQTMLLDAASTTDELRAVVPAPASGTTATTAKTVTTGLAALVAQVSRIDGWLRSVDVAFAHHGVLVVWSREAAWSRALDRFVDGAPAGQEWELDADDPDRGARKWLGDGEVAALATSLAALPAFRSARLAERDTTARELPEIAALHDDPDRERWDLQRVTRKAGELLAAEAETVIDRLTGRRDELAALLVAVPEFQAIRTADARARFAQDWLVEHTDGLRLPTWWVKELVAATKNLPRQPTL